MQLVAVQSIVQESDGCIFVLRMDTAVYDNMLQRAQKCIDVQRDHFQHLL